MKTDVEIRKFAQTKPVLQNGKVSGYATTYGNPDLAGDVVERGSLLPAYEVIPLLMNHDPSQLVGKITAWEERDTGLWIEAELIAGHPRYDEVAASLNAGALSGFSIGGRLVEYEDRPEGGRTFKQLVIHEISLTPIPMNPLARVGKTSYATVLKALALLRGAFAKE
jgi:HK97 family phage prohead protease